jgi:invasion protein IalB
MRPRLTPLLLLVAMAGLPAAAQETQADAAAEADATTTAETGAETGAAAEAATDAGAETETTADPSEAGTAVEAQPEAETGTPRSSVEDALDTGEAEQAPGTNRRDDNTFVKAEEGDWQVECIRLEDGSEGPCQLYQLLRAGEGNPVAEARVFKVEGGGQVVAGANIIVPLETLLTQKLTIAVDGGQAKRYDFAFCTQIGCIARIGFTQEDLDRFKRGAVAKVSIVPALAPDQRVVTDMSLSGFTAGFDQLAPIPAP